MNYLMNASGGHFRARTFTRPLSLALLGLCMAGLALPASAQSPTLADLDRMQAEWDVQHQRTLELIEEAEAAVKPTSAFAHLPPDAIALEAYVDKRLVSVESGFAMKVKRTEQGTPRVLFVNIDATPVGGFDLGPKQPMATATHTLYDLQQIAFGDCPANGHPRTGSVNRDGSGVAFQWSCGGDRRGRGRQYYSYSLEPDGAGIKTTFFTSNDQGVSSTTEHVYLPINDELLAAAAARLNQRREEERLRQAALRMQQAEQARDARAAKAERSAERGALFGAVLQGLAQGTAEALADQQHADYVQEAMLADLQRQTMQIQQAQAAEQPESQAQAEREPMPATNIGATIGAQPLSDPGRLPTLNQTDGTSSCPLMPRKESGTGVGDSREEAEAQATSYVRCGAGGIASTEEPICNSHTKTEVSMANGKTTTHNMGLRWTCGVVATCVVGRPVCPDGPKGSSAQ